MYFRHVVSLFVSVGSVTFAFVFLPREWLRLHVSNICILYSSRNDISFL